MPLLIPALGGALVVAGIIGVILGVRRTPVAPPAPRRRNQSRLSSRIVPALVFKARLSVFAHRAAPQSRPACGTRRSANATPPARDLAPGEGFFAPISRNVHERPAKAKGRQYRAALPIRFGHLCLDSAPELSCRAARAGRQGI